MIFFAKWPRDRRKVVTIGVLNKVNERGVEQRPKQGASCNAKDNKSAQSSGRVAAPPSTRSGARFLHGRVSHDAYPVGTVADPRFAAVPVLPIVLPPGLCTGI